MSYDDSGEPQKKIEVSGSAGFSSIAALARVILLVVVTLLVDNGYLPQGSAEGIVAQLIAGGTLAYGVWKTYRTKKQLIVTAEAAPNSIAVVK